MSSYAHFMTHERRVMVFNDPDFDPGPDAKPISTGNWLPQMILGRLPEDTKMVISFYKWDQITNFGPNLDEDADEVFWADAGGVVHVEVDSPVYHGWGSPFKVLGLMVSNGPKLTKRLKELARLTPYYTWDEPDIKFFTTTEDNEKFFDGISIISRSFAKRMGLKRYHKRGSLRSLSQVGLIKGDYFIISDKQMVKAHGRRYDIVTADVNLKSELGTTGWQIATANPHHDHSQALFDVQSASWLREWLYPRKLIMDTFTTVVDTVLESLRNGEWPAWMILTEEAHSDDHHTLPQSDERVSEAFHRHYLRWQLYGMKAEHSASIMGMARGQFMSRLNSKVYFPFSSKSERDWEVKQALRNDRDDPWKPRMWIPLPHAVYGHIITHDILKLAGFKIPSGCEDKLFYHEESGSFSLPGDQFADTFEAHGTWDLDDSAKFFLRKVKDDGRVVCVIVRSPNSDGEYSIHEVETDGFPLYHEYGEMPQIDLAEAPARIEHVMMHQVVDGMPINNRIADPVFTKDEAVHSVELQAGNPGVGAIANAMMVYYSSLGRSPQHVLATMGDIVDCAQQTPYQAGFTAISRFTDQLWSEVENYGKVDSFLARTRVPSLKKQSLAQYDGYFSRVFSHFAQETDRFDRESRPIAFRNRAANLIPEVMALDIDDAMMIEATRWWSKAETEFAAIARRFPGSSIYAQQQRKLANKYLVQRMANSLANMEEDEADNLVLAIYRTTVTPQGPPNVYGVTDRLLFAPAGPDDITVMEFFLRALIKLGAAQEPDFS